jgi:hypothetical protein
MTSGRFSRNFQEPFTNLMADSNEPKKETVRIALPPQPATGPGAANQSRDTLRINLPARSPATSSDSPGPTAPAPLPPKAPPAPPSAPVSQPERPIASVAAPVNIPAIAKLPGLSPSPPPVGSPSPKKETARVAPRLDPSAKPAPMVQMKKTQPLITMPESVPQTAPLTVARETATIVDAIPKPLCWAVLSTSAVILIIQIWNYFL